MWQLFKRKQVWLWGGILLLGAVILGACSKESDDDLALFAAIWAIQGASTASSVSWQFVDGGIEQGISDSSLSSTAGLRTNLATISNRLYASWSSGGLQLKVYGGDDASPVWTSITGTGATGLSRNSSDTLRDLVLIAFQSKLYAAWIESGTSTTKVRVSVYNGNDAAPAWTALDDNRDGNSTSLGVQGGKLYLAAGENVLVYNGNDGAPAWTLVNGSATNGRTFLHPFNSKLYATGLEPVSISAKVRVSVYNGNDGGPAWTNVDGGSLNTNFSDPSKIPADLRLTCDPSSSLYASWTDISPSIRIASYNGNDASPGWTNLAGAGSATIIRKPAETVQAIAVPRLAVLNSTLYVTWQEKVTTSELFSTIETRRIFAAKFSGTGSAPAWESVDGTGLNGLNASSAVNADSPSIAVLNEKLYIMWAEGPGIRVRVGTVQ